MKIAIVVGEASGDILGASLMRALMQQRHDIEWVGVGGTRMQQLGFNSFFDLESIAVMGLTEIIIHLPRLLRLRSQLIHYLLAQKIDVFIGIDAPDFNLAIEHALKKQGIKTVHWVSPSVWAWRQYRIHKIKRAVDLMLTLLPFEKALYDAHHIPCTFVGHPLADEIPLECDRYQARTQLGYTREQKILAILPGSRGLEVKKHLPLFYQVMLNILRQRPECVFIIPAPNQKRYQEIKIFLNAQSNIPPYQLVIDNTREALIASDVALTASGTATLEALLCKRPMVVAYRLSWFTWLLARLLVKVKFCSLPNLLHNRAIVPELLQSAATVPAITQQCLTLLDDTPNDLQQLFYQSHVSLRCNAGESAAKAILACI